MKKALSITLLVTLVLLVLSASAAPGTSPEASAAAKAAPLPDGLDLTEREAEIFRLGFAMGYDAALSPDDDEAEQDYVLNTNTMKFHRPTCDSVKQMKEKNRKDFHGTRDRVISMGYVPCKNCNP